MLYRHGASRPVDRPKNRYRSHRKRAADTHRNRWRNRRTHPEPPERVQRCPARAQGWARVPSLARSRRRARRQARRQVQPKQARDRSSAPRPLRNQACTTREASPRHEWHQNQSEYYRQHCDTAWARARPAQRQRAPQSTRRHPHPRPARQQPRLQPEPREQ